MRILVTGSAGLIGSAVHKKLSQEHEVITLGRRGNVDVLGDLAEPEKISKLHLPSIDALVHCAGVIDEDFVEDPHLAIKKAIFGADALVQCAVKAGATKLVYISSAHVYGPMCGSINERSLLNPIANYAIAHFATEQIFRRNAHAGISAVALRPCAVFGDLANLGTFRRWTLIPFSFPRDAVLNHNIIIRSTGEQLRNFVGSDDIAHCCSRWLNQDSVGWMGLNPMGGATISVYEFAKVCAVLSEKITGKPCQITRNAPTGLDFGSDYSYQSLSDITLGHQSLQDTLERLMQALLKD